MIRHDMCGGMDAPGSSPHPLSPSTAGEVVHFLHTLSFTGGGRDDG